MNQEQEFFVWEKVQETPDFITAVAHVIADGLGLTETNREQLVKQLEEMANFQKAMDFAVGKGFVKEFVINAAREEYKRMHSAEDRNEPRN